MFDKLIWQKDRMLLDDLVFRLEQCKSNHWGLADECFVFYKTKPLIDQYARFWTSKPQWCAQNIFELGIWDGGSVAFWFEYFHPKKHVAVDKKHKRESKYFQRYKQSKGLEERIKTYWGTDQADPHGLRRILNREFNEPLDLVIDDASHMYLKTKKCFEILFPLLRPGGLYIIEDWAWGHWKEFQTPNHPWAARTPLTELIFDIVEAIGSSRGLIAGLNVFQGFVAVERGEAPSAELGGFKIEKWISRRPKISWMEGKRSRWKHIFKKIKLWQPAGDSP